MKCLQPRANPRPPPTQHASGSKQNEKVCRFTKKGEKV
jgi:hypothetical protein